MHIKLTLLAGAALAGMSVAAVAQTTPPPPEQPTQPQPDEPATQDQQTAPDTTQQPPADEPATQQTQPAQQPAAQATGQVVKATATDLKAGVAVYDSKGGLVGKIDSVESDGAVVDTGTVKAKLGLSSFGRNDKGLVISMTKTELEAAAKAKSPK